MLSSRLLVTLRCVRPLLQFSYPPPHFRRNFSLTPRPQAAENPDSFITAFKHTSLFRKLADKPEALIALTNFAKLMQDLGIDFTTGKPPSTMQMLKLAANSEFREGAKRVAEEMEKAGVDLKSKEVMEELMSLKKPPGGSESSS